MYICIWKCRYVCVYIYTYALPRKGGRPSSGVNLILWLSWVLSFGSMLTSEYGRPPLRLLTTPASVCARRRLHRAGPSWFLSRYCPVIYRNPRCCSHAELDEDLLERPLQGKTPGACHSPCKQCQQYTWPGTACTHHPGDNPGSNRLFLWSTLIRMLPPGGSVSERLT